MTNSSFIEIVGLGHVLPDRVVPNAELTQLFSTSDEWIRDKIGIAERRYVAEGEGASDLALKASRMALDRAQLKPEDIDAIVVSSSTPDYCVPGVGVLLQDKLGCRTVPAYDIHNSSPGFLFTMEMASALLESGRYQTLLAVGSEVHSTALDFSDRGRMMSVIFGDGAGAWVLKRKADGENRRLKRIETQLFSEGRHFDKLWCEAPAGRYNPRINAQMIEEGRIYPQMDGRFIFEQAVLRMADACRTLLSRLGLKTSDINWVVPHQANMRIIEKLGDTLGVPREKVVTTIEKTGNLSSASIPLVLSTIFESGKLKRGDLVLSPSFGSGFSWGAMVYEF